MDENMNENKTYEENTENLKEDMNGEPDLLDSPSINDPYDDLEDEVKEEEKQEKKESEAQAEQKQEEAEPEEKKKIEEPEVEGKQAKEKDDGKELKTEQKQNGPHIVMAGGKTFYSREFTKELITQVLKLQTEGMIRYGKDFMQNEAGMQKNQRSDFGLSPMAGQMPVGGTYGSPQNPMMGGYGSMMSAGTNGYGQSAAGSYGGHGGSGSGTSPQQMSQYGKQAGNTKEGKTLLGELAYIFGEVPILGILLELLDKIWKGCMNIARKTDEVLSDKAGRAEPDQRLQQMMQETEALRDSCRQRLEADRNFMRQAGTYMDASMGTNYMGADQIPEYGTAAARLFDPAVSPEFSGFLNANGGEKTAEVLLEKGTTLREKNDAKKESAERENVEKDSIAKEEGRQEKKSAGERRWSRDDSDLISHRRPTMEQINMEPQKERSRGRSL